MVNPGTVASMATPYRNPDWVVPVLIIGSVQIVTCLCSLCYSLYVYKTYHTYHSKKKEKLPTRLKIFNFCGILAFLLCAVWQSINGYYYNKIYWEFSTLQTMSWYFTWLFWSIGQFISYLLFLDRIKSSFTGSIYQPSAATKSYLYILLTIFGIVWAIANFLPFLMYIQISDNTSIDRSLVFKVEFYCSIPVGIIDIIITISMVHIFVSRLYKLVLTQTKVDHDDFSSNSRQEPLLLKDSHLNMIRISVKITILSVTSLLSSVVLFVFRGITYFAYAKGIKSDAEELTGLLEALWLRFDTIISCLCLMLFLPKTKKGFKIFCCCCKFCCEKIMEKAVSNHGMSDHRGHRITLGSPSSKPINSEQQLSRVSITPLRV